MTRVQYKCFDKNGKLEKIVDTLPEAKDYVLETGGRYEIYYTYKESYAIGHAWVFKRLSGLRT